VFLELENAAVVSPDALKNAIAIEQTVVKHGHFGVPFTQIFTVDENLHANGG
jgi:hypothetical protein